MSDLISRQAAIEETWKEPSYTDPLNVLAELRDRIKDLPSAQPEIIRCKDCKWSDWYDSTDGNRYCYCMETGAAGRTADDFCSYAERRTDERSDKQKISTQSIKTNNAEV